MGRRQLPLIVLDMRNFDDMRCRKCQAEKPQSHFKEVRYYVPMRRGRMIKMYYPVCHECRTDRMAKWAGSPIYNANVDEFLRRLTSRQKSACGHRDIAFLLEPEYVIDLYIAQKGLCALSGVKMMTEEGCTGAKNYFAASIDRIDSTDNYIDGNVQLVCAGVNLMKQDLPQVKFLEFCRKVVEHHANKMDELEAQIGCAVPTTAPSSPMEETH